MKGMLAYFVLVTLFFLALSALYRFGVNAILIL